MGNQLASVELLLRGSTDWREMTGRIQVCSDKLVSHWYLSHYIFLLGCQTRIRNRLPSWTLAMTIWSSIPQMNVVSQDPASDYIVSWRK